MEASYIYQELGASAQICLLRLLRLLCLQGGAKVQEAFYIYQELGDKYTWTVRLHSGLAACQMRMGRWEDAESELLQVRWVLCCAGKAGQVAGYVLQW